MSEHTANTVVRTEVLTELIDGEPHYGVMEVIGQPGRQHYRVHYGPHVLQGNGVDWGSISADDHNMRVAAEALFSCMVRDYPRP